MNSFFVNLKGLSFTGRVSKAIQPLFFLNKGLHRVNKHFSRQLSYDCTAKPSYCMIGIRIARSWKYQTFSSFYPTGLCKECINVSLNCTFNRMSTIWFDLLIHLITKRKNLIRRSWTKFNFNPNLLSHLQLKAETKGQSQERNRCQYYNMLLFNFLC